MALVRLEEFLASDTSHAPQGPDANELGQCEGRLRGQFEYTQERPVTLNPKP